MYLLLDAVSITARLKCNVPRLVQQAKFPFLEFTFTSVLHPGMPMTGIQYNTIQMSFEPSNGKFRTALIRLGGANVVVLHSNCVRRTCSRSLHSSCLGQESNTYSPHYRPSALTNRPTCIKTCAYFCELNLAWIHILSRNCAATNTFWSTKSIKLLKWACIVFSVCQLTSAELQLISKFTNTEIFVLLIIQICTHLLTFNNIQ